MMRELIFLDIRLGREFLAFEEFAGRSGIALQALEELAEENSIDFVSFDGTRYISWLKQGVGISLLAIDSLLQEFLPDDVSSKNNRKRNQNGTP